MMYDSKCEPTKAWVDTSTPERNGSANGHLKHYLKKPFTQKWKFYYLFTLKLYDLVSYLEHKIDILKNVGNQTAAGSQLGKK